MENTQILAYMKFTVNNFKSIKYMKRLSVFSIFFLMVFSLNAQRNNQTSGLSAKEIEDFQEMTGQMIDRLQKYLSILGSKDKTDETKAMYQKQTLKLFMGKGDPYTDADGNSQRAVHMQVSSTRTKQINNVPLKKYLKNLMSLPYAKVEITKADAHRISNIYKVGDHYEATATIFQRFCGYGLDNRKRYCDVTTKTIRIYIIMEEDFIGKKWVIRFGDIDVAETTGN